MAKSEQEKQAAKAAVKAHQDAKDELERVSKRDRKETPAYLAANRAVIEAEKNIPWWRR